jgi:pilus assembly protein Flp/PilA
MLANFNSMVRDEDGASMIEYGLLVVLIALVALGAVQTLGAKLGTPPSSSRQSPQSSSAS